MEMSYRLLHAILFFVSLEGFNMTAEVLNTTVVCGYQTDRFINENKELICPTCTNSTWEYVNETEGVARHCRKLCDVSNPACERNTVCKELSTSYSACVCAKGYALSSFGKCEEILNTTLVCGYQTNRFIDGNNELVCSTCTNDGWEFINETEGVARHCRQLCGVSNPDCGTNTVCKKLPTNYSACVCAKGYALSSFGKCEELCDVSNPACGTNTVCKEISTSYSVCVCAKGYALSSFGKCEDIDEYEGKSPCAENQKCINSLGSYTCQCIDDSTNCIDPGTKARSPPDAEGPNYALIGGILGGVILLLIIVVIVIVYRQRTKKRRSEKIRQAKLEAGRIQSEAEEHDYVNQGSGATNLQSEAEVEQEVPPELENQDVVAELDSRDLSKVNQNFNRISDLYSNNKIVKDKKVTLE